MNKFLLIIVSFLIISPFIYSEETPKEQPQTKSDPTSKKLHLIFRRQGNRLHPLESAAFSERYPAYHGDENNRTNNLYVGFKYPVLKWDSYLDGSFYELKKGELSKEVFYCNPETCYPSDYSIGSYYRSESQLNLIKNIFSEKVGIGAGIRYINSNLSLNFPNNYDLYIGSASMGPQITFRYQTPELYGFSISAKLDYFHLLGTYIFKNSYESRNAPLGFNKYSNLRASEYKGTDFSLALNYSVTENIMISLGGSFLNAYMTPNTKDVYSFDPNYDLRRNLENRLNGSSYIDRIYSGYLQIVLKIDTI
ncbi:hypothetical protein [Leptospira koniambonensis]|uniref:hypothetical protein n=1 Tax=Leptospira koniambonensis TaxID=2484950 RepID=UPI003EC06EC3